MEVSVKLFPVSASFTTKVKRTIVSYNVNSKKFALNYPDFYENHIDECRKAVETSLASQDSFEHGLILGSGNLIDFDLILLIKKLENLTFLDYDQFSTPIVLRNFESKKHVNFIAEDLNGVTNDIVININLIAKNAIGVEDYLASIVQYLSTVEFDTGRKKLVDYLGSGKYDFVSSSLVISQLPALIVTLIENKMGLWHNNMPSLQDPSTIDIKDDFRSSLSALIYKMYENHIRLISELIKPGGTFHFVTTNSLVYVKGNEPVTEEIPLYDMETMSELISTYFEIPDEQQTWLWYREAPNPNRQTPVFHCLAATCKAK
jgi:hypothetical protein